MIENEKVKKAKMVLLAMMRHPWEQGVAANAFIEAGDDEIAVQLAHEAVYRQVGDGRLACLSNTRNITDPCVCGESVMFAYEKTGNSLYKEAAEKMLRYIENAPGDKDGIQYHNYDQPMIAADCMYMIPTFYAVMGKYQEAVRQAEIRFNLLWNDEKKILHHQWNAADHCMWRDKFWGAASGWNIAALVKVIHLLPENMQDEKKRLTDYLDKLTAGILCYQRDDGLFHDILDDRDTFVETNCAQMTAYGIYRGVTYGILDKSYIPVAIRMRDAANRMVDKDGYVRGVAGAPAFTASGISPEGQAFYILMEAAAADYENSMK